MANQYKEIAIGILVRDSGGEKQFCLSRRQQHQSFAGCWEFPGGKVNSGESVEQALLRELQEELGVVAMDFQHLVTIPWDYGEFAVRLNVYLSERFADEPAGKEGQEVRWFNLDDLSELEFPAANQGIIEKLKVLF